MHKNVSYIKNLGGLFNVKISSKIILSFTVVILLVFVLGFFSVFALNSISKNSTDLFNKRLNPITDLGNINRLAENTRVQMVSAGLYQDMRYANEAEENIAKINELIKNYESEHVTAAETETFESFKNNWKEYELDVNDNIKVIKSGNYEELDAGLKKAGIHFEAASKDLALLLEINENEAKKLMEESQSTYGKVLNILILVVVVVILLSIAITIILTRLIVKPIKAVNKQIAEIADGEGDLTKELTINTNDELGELAQSFNKMVRSLRVLIQRVVQSMDEVASSAEQLNASSDQTSKSTELLVSAIEQMASGSKIQSNQTEEGAKALENISASIQTITENAFAISDLSSKAITTADEGMVYVGDTSNQMVLISDSVGDSNSAIESLNNRSKEIENIVVMITNITQQTNLLALNAAIEAARAGEHGRGFAVVADEVRKLAEESSDYSNKIAELIKEIQLDTQNVVGKMTQVKADVDEGNYKTAKTKENFTQIAIIMKEINEQVHNMSASSQHIAAGTEQVTASVTEIASIAKENAAGTQEVSMSAEEQMASMEEISSSATALTELAEELQQLVGKFKV